MRTDHQSGTLQMLSATPRQGRLAGALRLQAGSAGWLWVDSGAVWITRQGEGIDHVLSAAEALYLGRGDQVVAEPWHTDRQWGCAGRRRLTVRPWQPCGAPRVRWPCARHAARRCSFRAPLQPRA